MKEIKDEQKIWEHEEQEQKQLNENYVDLYIKNLESWNKREQKQQKKLEKVNNIVETLYEKPFGTTVDLKNLDIDECEKLSPLLKKWYEDKIKNQEIKDKIAIVMTVNNKEIF